MGILGGMARRVEQRASLENPRVPLSDAKAWAAVFGAMDAASGIDVTPDKALSVPAVWCAVNFIANTFAALPAPVFKKTEAGREKDERNPVYILLHDWVNDDYLTSFAWRKQAMVDTLLTGRSYTFVEGKRSGRITNLWPLNPFNVTVERVNGQRRYKYRNGEKQFVYGVDEIIDVPFMVGFDKLSSVNPTSVLRDTLGLCIALERYASRFFRNGGVPPLAMQMPSGASAGAARRGAANIEELIQSANDGSGLVLPMPEGHRLEAVGFEPAKGQLTEARLYQIREIARIYGLPPIFLQDLQFGTYCLPASTEVLTVNGPVSIADVKVGEIVYGRGERGGVVQSRVVRSSCTGSDPILTIKTTNRTLKANAKHRILARRERLRDLRDGEIGGRNVGGEKKRVEWVTEYVAAGELRVGDTIVAFNGSPDTGSYRGPTRPLTVRFVELCGLYIGDGSLERNGENVNGFSIARASHATYMDHYRGVICDSFTKYPIGTGTSAAAQTIPVTLEERERATRVNSRSAARELADLGLSGTAHTKSVPAWVFSASDTLKLAFLRGFLDADGSVDKNGRISFSSCNIKLLSGIRHLCMMLGIPVTNIAHRTGINHPPCAKEPCEFSQWYFTCSDPGANRRIGSHTPEYIRRLDAGIPFSSKKGRSYPRFGGKDFYEDGLELTRIVAIDLGEAESVYDLEVAGTHSFVADGVVVHNSNTEQQDLMLVKHTLTQWLVCWEQELNAKLFGPRSKNYIRFNQDGLLRGDYTTRMTGHAQAVQNGIKTPDECRELEDMAPKGGLADKLFIQGATVPLGMQPVFAKPQEPPPADQQQEEQP